MRGKKLHGVGVRDVVEMHFDVFNEAQGGDITAKALG